ncbi:MAG: thioredoxin domain-containing protein [Chloroflexi bacterium]|nr:thioredoxin domain-containing protein [Chloroflexota bacterium]
MIRSLTRPFALIAVLLLLVGVVGFAGVVRVAAQDDDLRTVLATLPSARTADGGYIVGNPDAPITIVEFSDFACPHCLDYRTTIDQFILDHVLTGQARFELRVFPTAGGRRTVYASRVAECAETLHGGGFWQASEILYEYAEIGSYYAPLGRVVADELGIDYLSMLGCIWRARQVIADYEFATGAGITGTPAVMVRYADGEAVFVEHEGVTYDRGPVPLDILAAVIEEANG